MAVTDISRRVEGLSPQKRALLEQALKKRVGESGSVSPLRRRPHAGPAPLSFSQQRIWFLEQWEPGGFTHNGARAFRLRGSIDRAALERALTTIVERHEVLRTVYVLENREPRQKLLEEWKAELPLVDLSATDSERREDELAQQLRELSREPFDLTCDLMLRATLFRLAPNDHAFLIRLHHIAFDAFSDRVFFSELGSLYSGFAQGYEPGLPDLSIQYADFAVWQREQLSGARLAKLTDYWRGALAGAPAMLQLPIDGVRRSPQRHEGRHRELSLSSSLIQPVIELGRSVGATPYMTLLAAFAVVLYRITGEDDVMVGTPIANRGRTELESLIGFFSNTLAMRIRLDGNPSFREVLARTRETAVAAYAHQELPFDRIVEELQVKRDPRYNPIFQVNFRAQTEVRRTPLDLVGVETAPIVVDIGFSRFDLALELQFETGRIGGYLEYDLDLFEPATIDAFALELESTLEQLVREPDRSVLESKVNSRWRQRVAPPKRTPIRRSREP